MIRRRKRLQCVCSQKQMKGPARLLWTPEAHVLRKLLYFYLSYRFHFPGFSTFPRKKKHFGERLSGEKARHDTF